jgi:hypothetical protein
MDANQPPQQNLIHVFRAGTHVTAAGETIEFTQADLLASAAAYDPALHEAPLVVGHPKTDGPAYGWAKGLQVQGNDLFVVPDQVNPEFAEMVRSGAFKKRSLKWYRPADPLNPRPGVWYPQHVGFLGATPPAIKGLKPVELAQNVNGVEVEFSQWEDRLVARMFRRLREWFIAQHGQETADRVIDGYDVDALAEEAAREDAAAALVQAPVPSPVFSEVPPVEEPQVTPEEKAALEAENASLKQKIAESQARDVAAQAAARKSGAVQFCESLIGEGKVLPAEKDTVVGLLVLAASAQPVEFGEGTGAVNEAPLARLQGLLKALPKRVEFSEIAKPELAAAAVEFSAPQGMPVSGERLALHQRAVAHQAAHPGTDYVAAVKAVS